MQAKMKDGTYGKPVPLDSAKMIDQLTDPNSKVESFTVFQSHDKHGHPTKELAKAQRRHRRSHKNLKKKQRRRRR